MNKITMVTIYDAIHKYQGIIKVDTEDEIKQIRNLCEFFNIDNVYPKYSLYTVKLPGLVSDNGQQYLASSKGQVFAVAGGVLNEKKYLLKLSEIPHYLHRYAKKVL